MERGTEGMSRGDSGRMGHRGDPLSMISGCCLCFHFVGTRHTDTVWAQAKQPLPRKGPEAVQVSLHAENVSFSILQEVCPCGVLSIPLGAPAGWGVP